MWHEGWEVAARTFGRKLSADGPRFLAEMANARLAAMVGEPHMEDAAAMLEEYLAILRLYEKSVVDVSLPLQQGEKALATERAGATRSATTMGQE